MRATLHIPTFASLSCLLLHTVHEGNAFTTPQHLSVFSGPSTFPRDLACQMKKDDPRRATVDDAPLALSAASISDGFTPSKILQGNAKSALKSLSNDAQNILPVISAALLITSNTVGASMMVLPDLARGPGLLTSTGILGAIYAINLVSGLLIAEVGINQYEKSACDVPSSFKEFADVNLESDKAATFISAISLFVNTCVLSFDIVRASEISASAMNNEVLLPIFGPQVMETLSSTLSSGHASLLAVATFFVTLVGTQNDKTLSGIASVCCITLFACFAGLVLPGLAMIQDPIAVVTAAGTSDFGSQAFSHDISSAVPVLVTAMIYQNIVPTITKLLNYDRVKVVTAIALGSFIPMMMYISFCYTVLGGGAVSNIGAESVFLSGIKASSVFGSAMACLISIGEELNCYFSSTSEKALESCGIKIETTKEEERSPLLPYILGIIPPVLVGTYFSGEGCVGALQISGSYGSPLLYGIIPVFLAFTQRTKIFNESSGDDTFSLKTFAAKLSRHESHEDNRLVSGGLVPLGGLTLAAGALITSHLVEDVSAIASLAHL